MDAGTVNLFGDPVLERGEVALPSRPIAPAPGPFAAVAIEQSIDRTLDYSIPPRLVHVLKVGQLVRVPLGRGNRPKRGYVISIKPTTEFPNNGKIKPVKEIEDDRVLVSPRMMELARWISRYYITPLGTVLETIIPSAVKKRVGLGYLHHVRLLAEPAKIQELLEKTKAPKRRAIMARLLQLEPDASIELLRLASEAGATPPTVRKLVRAGVISMTAEPDSGSAGKPRRSPERWRSNRVGPAT